MHWIIPRRDEQKPSNMIKPALSECKNNPSIVNGGAGVCLIYFSQDCLSKKLFEKWEICKNNGFSGQQDAYITLKMTIDGSGLLHCMWGKGGLSEIKSHRAASE